MMVWLRPVILVMVMLALVVSALTVGAQVPARQVLYEARLNDTKDLYLLDIDRGVAYNLTRSPGEDIRPSWSPDGSRIVFESWRDGVRAVYVMNADGSGQHRLSADAGASEYDPRWSPDGQTIMFRSLRRAFGGETSVNAYQVNPDGTNLKRIDPDSGFQVASADHYISQRFESGSWALFVTQGNKTWHLTNIPFVFRETPRWSFDRRLIAFLSPAAASESEVYVMDTDGAHLRQVTADGMTKSNLSWRPT